MKSFSYKYGKWTCKTYLKTVGNGWEVGFLFDNKPVFVGNFIHSTEAVRWYRIMNREIRQFARKYTTGTVVPATWFKHFIKNHLYKSYYGFLDRLFAKYNRTYKNAFARDLRWFSRHKKQWATGKKTRHLKAA